MAEKLRAASRAHSLFISDLHLSEARSDLLQAFQQFCLNQAVGAESLYILGDLSDAWLGDDDHSPAAEIIRQTLRSVSESGTKVYLMNGNRDFLMGDRLAADCGLQLLQDPSVIDLHGNSVLLMHGDSLCTSDRKYMAFRAKIQNGITKQILLALPLAFRRKLAVWLRARSQRANSDKVEYIMDVTPAEVIRVMREHDVSVLIHGHTHRPAVHTVQLDNAEAFRYVLGDWDDSGWYIEADCNSIELKSFSLT